MRNNKGYMLVEIIIASVITMTIAYLLLDLTYSFKTSNDDTFYETIFLTEKTLMTKEVMNDINNNNVQGVDFSCNTGVDACFEIKFKDGEDSITKRLTINNNIYEYGTYNDGYVSSDYYKKTINEKLNISKPVINNHCYGEEGETVNGILTCKEVESEQYALSGLLEITLPLSSNFLKENYGVKISIPYSTLKVDNDPQPTSSMINLIDGMIPVKYDGSKWVKADLVNNNNDWFNYKEKQWANVAMVKETNPATYSCPGEDTLEGEFCYSDAIKTYSCASSTYYLSGERCCSRNNYCTFSGHFVFCNCPTGLSQWGSRCCTGATPTYNCDSEETLDGTRCKSNASKISAGGNSREYYMNAASGTEILESDILAYFVWIPRYKYKLWNVEFGETSPQEIEIIFENTTDPISNGTTNGEYLSHPAFWWDNDSDGIREAGEELSGIWVGKFEITGDTTNPTILPNITSLRNVNISGLFSTSQKLGTSTYLTTNGVNQVDAHMMKNMEWGAVAYLSHSKYGKNSEITRNNNSGYLTGGGAYKINIAQSTTGNITGIYDMSGGALEYIMGVMEDNTGTNTPMSGQSSTYNSGWTGKIYENGSWIQYSGTTYPDKKYYDLYNYGTTYDDQAAYNRSKLGDATGETRGWYSNRFFFIHPFDPWFVRGGINSGNNLGGVFYASGLGANGFSNRSARITLSER